MIEAISSIDELWSWEVPTGGPAVRKLSNFRDKYSLGEREVMVCHDFKGGYLEEESAFGCDVRTDINPFVFLNWWNIDIFCYFTHHLVTIPPSGYINVAHDHGCIVMGTFITEWDKGREICSKILESRESVEQVVDKLVTIAAHFQFEGWLINIENEIMDNFIENLKLFLSALTDKMKRCIPYSRVIWYDSVTKNGYLKWQNELNIQNREFYEICDGIYLNYNWDDQKLLNSADFGVLHKIFVGIDCFGRGCIGGWNCYKSFAKACLMRYSIALFAPGWISEAFPQGDPIMDGLKFWKKLIMYTPSRPITELPVSTNFGCGFSKKGQWFNLNSIALQPHFNQANIVPQKQGGLLLPICGIYRIFEFDIEVPKCKVIIESSNQIGILINESHCDISKQNNRMFETVILSPFSLKSLDVNTLRTSTILYSLKLTLH